jgi:hypothetical protein
MKIRELFDSTRPIDRHIVSVINYAADSEDLLKQEVSEYEVTDKLAHHYERFMTNLSDGFQGGGNHEVGVWVSGFYGSGKSSLTKYLGFALDPSRKIGNKPFLEYLQAQFPTQALRQQLGLLAKNHPATVIMVDLASIASADSKNQGVSRLVFEKVMHWAGYARDEKIALLELMVERDGRKDEFLKLVAKQGMDWSDLRSDLLVSNTVAGEVAAEMYPKIWKGPGHFSSVKVDSIYGEDERLKQMLDLIEKRTGSARVLFVLDEVGQFIEGTDRLILNVQGFAENLKNIGKGDAWIVCTAQQTLPVSGPLFKLKDRFPQGLRIDIESSDIREITYRRLLKKSPEALKRLKELFNAHSGALTTATHLKNTKLTQATLDAEVFSQLYPFLPQHFNILMELLRGLARSTGGIGLRSTLKVIQDVLVDVGGKRRGETLLADQEVGALATADAFYDTLANDIERVNRPLVETVNKISAAFGVESLHLKVAKAIAVLQLIEGFPVSRHNVAALLHRYVSDTPLVDKVNAAVQELIEDKEIALEEIEGSLRFMSEAVAQIMANQASLIPSVTDQNKILDDALRDIFTPEPVARLANTKAVKAQVKLLRSAIPVPVTHTKEDVEIHMELASPAELAARLIDRRNQSLQPNSRNTLLLLGEDSPKIRDLITKIYRCEETHRANRTDASEKEVADFVKAQLVHAETHKRDLETALQDAFIKGHFIFRGTDSAVATKGTELRAACNAELGHVADQIYPNYKDAPENMAADAAEKLLLTQNLSTIPSAIDPLGLVEKAGPATRIKVDSPALVAIVDYLGKNGDVEGRKLLDDFSRPPYGWFKDTTRHLVAALLLAQKVRLRVGAQWIDVNGPKALEVFKNNTAFVRADFATNATQIPQDVLLRASQRLLTLTGEDVLPMAPNICKAVQKHFPTLRNNYNSLGMELTSVKLPGAERAQTLSKQLGQIMDRDASDAPVTLGAQDASIVEDLGWAREVRKALDDGLGNDCAAALTACEEIERLPGIGALAKLKTSSVDLRNEMSELLTREDFHLVASDIRRRKGEIESMVAAVGSEFAKELRISLQQQIDGIQEMPEWGELPEADKAEFASDLNSITIQDAGDLAEIRALTNQQLEINAQLNTARAGVVARWKKHKEATPLPNESNGEAKRVRIRPRYTASDVAQLMRSVEEMGGALEALKASKVNEVLLEMDGVKYPEAPKKR